MPRSRRLLWVLCVGSLLPCRAGLAAEGYLPNGSMSEGKDLPASWRLGDRAGQGTVVAARDTQTFKKGPSALRLTVTGGAQGSVLCSLPAVSGKEVAVTGWIKAEGSLKSATLAFICPGTEQPWNPVRQVAARGGWRRVNAKVKLPAGGEAPFLLLQIEGDGSAWLDEAAVLPADQFKPEPTISEFDAAPLFSFLAWEKKAKLVDEGVHLAAPTAQGGAGFTLAADLSAYVDRVPALTVKAGSGHKAQRVRLALHDADGTSHEYQFKLVAPAGQSVTLTAENGATLGEPSKVAAAGRTEGLDAARLTQMVLQGDWSQDAVDLTFVKLELVAATPEMQAAREKLRAQREADAEKARKAEAARAARTAELLEGAPHHDDGPAVQHVGAVAPDVLALSIQEKQFVPVAQIPYEPQAGDEVRRSGKNELLVVEDGKVKESPIEVSVYRADKKGKAVEIGHLAVNAKQLKPADKTLGADLSVETVALPKAYRVTSHDDPAYASPQPPRAVSWKRKPNAARSTAHQVEVFLTLPKPLHVGRAYTIEFPGVNLRQPAVTYRHEPTQTRSPAIHVSAIGFRPDDPFKRAYLSQWLGTGGGQEYAPGLRFALLDEATGKEAFSGKATLLVAADGKESFKAGRNYGKTDVYGLDFSSFATPGKYRVYVEGIGCSYPFTIGEHVWTEAFRLSMRGLLHHRSGIELGPPSTDYRRPRPMHPADGVKVFASAGSEIEGGGQDGIFKMLAERRTDRLLSDAWGGHMDAGDWDRNTNHPAAMWLLVDLYELFPRTVGAVKLALPPAEANNGIPDVLDEVLWNLELHRRLQAPDGGISGGIESTAHPRPGEASWQESLLLSAFAPDPRASFVYAGTAAKLARALAKHDKALAETYSASARKAWTWAVAHEAAFAERLAERKGRPATELFRTARNLAALELWLLTDEGQYHDDFRATTLLADKNPEIMKQHKAILSYARLPDGRGDPVLRDAARRLVLKTADTALEFGAGNAFGVTTGVPQLPPMGFVGYLSTPEMIGAVLPQAWLLTNDPKYLAGAVRACQFAAGANPDNRALTTGLGPDPVRFPLHIDSWVTGQPAPAGITVYGISDPAENYDFDSWAYTWFLQKMTPPPRTWPAHESYWDIYCVPSSNEYTIHQTIIPTAYYWGFLAARETLPSP